ncbi:glucosamine-6-phosphate deaminase [Roseibacillus ishigakijimensis]|uniref:Glucosamine-6-phosphate deaminase n=1 Tax=Roseibacillus ishigakijimensis TaxID=454146 RepID=A0A934RLU1_9BACT|nr:glucosamine-6-phosphate deaminase [Roseibacillus ishigakijimensis]MBK1833759.1 glucosamine-6-phosphate deaminase [Roseibacillus ishigakijimensis]
MTVCDREALLCERDLGGGLRVEVYNSPEEASRAVAGDFLGRALDGRLVAGFATGGTPERFYDELGRRAAAEGACLREVVGFNLDEYLGLAADDVMSYSHYMHSKLYQHVAMAQIHLMDGLTANPEEECARYERAIAEAGGIDWQLLGIGGNGHLGFNEPGSPRDSRTRVVALAERTRSDAAPAFGGLDKVPTQAMSMGLGTILEGRQLVMMAWGKGKAGIVERALTGPVSEEVPASFLQEHGAARVILDRESGAWLL